LNIPNTIKEIIGDMSYSIDTIGMSKSQVICFNDMVLKIEKHREESDNEHRMMAWLTDKLPVPQILCSEKENGINYLLMTRIIGEMSCSIELLVNPRHLTKLLADGLRMLWSVDISKCPYNNSIDNKLRLAEIRVLNNLCDMEDAETTTYGANGFENPEKLLQWLKENRPDEELVFSHGDYCLPNIFIKDDKINGFIDLGRSGVADIYQDIALCYRSLQHMFGSIYGERMYEGFDAKILFDELKIVPDWNKIKFYILLDELF
jgi:kanamycin kinase/aminoglycoside 3'-phosphotransferase-3